MSAALRLRSMLRTARVRVVTSGAIVWLPLVAAAAALVWRFGGTAAAAVVGAVGIAAAIGAVAWRARRIDTRWLARVLDSRRSDMDDSAALLFADRADLSVLQRLQRERLRQRIAGAPTPDLRPPWPWRGVAIAAGVALLLIAAALFWPTAVDRDGMRAAPAAAVAPGAPRLAAWRLHIQPPGYTGLQAYDAESLDAKAPEGSQLRWTLRFDPQPEAVELLLQDGVSQDGGQLVLERGDDGWRASHALTGSALYRIVPAGAPTQPPLHRLDAVVDEPPTVRVLAPGQTLSLMAPGQRRWPLSFEASDDYGVAAEARLHLTLAQGTGENITFIESTRTLRGSGDGKRLRFGVDLDPVALGLAQGEDLVARLEVRDNRAPRPQSARSASLILRWPPDPPPDVDGLDALARDVLPAYFRSQRQIIIDAEALLEEQPALEPERFLSRSDALGVDQRVLRLRYGQFMGEETEGGPEQPPTHDAEPAATLLPIDDRGQESSAPTPAGDDSGDPHAQVGMLDLHDHDHDQAPREAAAFGSMEGVLEEYAHLHDLPEAATLLDPRTRETLRSALGEMWQSELALRQGDPARALPYAYRALEYIQQVREADRIYLARVGSQLPPIDEGRRLGGERDGIGRRQLPPSTYAAGADALDDAWIALAEAPGAGEVDLEALETWLAGNQAWIDDPLSLAAAIDALRNDPGCAGCRDELRALLWTLLERPAAQVQRRETGDEAGVRYLDALQSEDTP